MALEASRGHQFRSCSIAAVISETDAQLPVLPPSLPIPNQQEPEPEPALDDADVLSDHRLFSLQYPSVRNAIRPPHPVVSASNTEAGCLPERAAVSGPQGLLVSSQATPSELLLGTEHLMLETRSSASGLFGMSMFDSKNQFQAIMHGTAGLGLGSRQLRTHGSLQLLTTMSPGNSSAYATTRLSKDVANPHSISIPENELLKNRAVSATEEISPAIRFNSQARGSSGQLAQQVVSMHAASGSTNPDSTGLPYSRRQLKTGANPLAQPSSRAQPLGSGSQLQTPEFTSPSSVHSSSSSMETAQLATPPPSAYRTLPSPPPAISSANKGQARRGSWMMAIQESDNTELQMHQGLHQEPGAVALRNRTAAAAPGTSSSSPQLLLPSGALGALGGDRASGPWLAHCQEEQSGGISGGSSLGPRMPNSALSNIPQRRMSYMCSATTTAMADGKATRRDLGQPGMGVREAPGAQVLHGGVHMSAQRNAVQPEIEPCKENAGVLAHTPQQQLLDNSQVQAQGQVPGRQLQRQHSSMKHLHRGYTTGVGRNFGYQGSGYQAAAHAGHDMDADENNDEIE